MEVTTLHIPSMTTSVSETLYQFQQQRYLCDVLIFTSDGYIPAHRVVLVAASKYFREIESSRNIHTTPEANFYLTKEKSEDMQKIVELIYTGDLNISTENFKRIHSLCLTLGFADAIKELENFYGENISMIEENDDDDLMSENEANQLSLKQLETEVINHLEKSMSNNNTSVNISQDEDTMHIRTDKQNLDGKIDLANEMREDGTPNQEQIDRRSKVKGHKIKIKKFENNFNENESEAMISFSPEKFINCSLCKEKFQDKKQLMEHRRSRHSNKRKPMHTKRYIPSSDANETLSDNEDQDNSPENSISNKSPSEKQEDEDFILSTRQGTKRRSAESFTKLRKASRFVCRLCKDEFSNNDLLQEHRKLIHPGGKRENLTCQLCDKVLSTWLNLIEHKYKKHNIGYDEEKYKVLMCDMPVSIVYEI